MPDQTDSPIRIATRGSSLAMWQAQFVAAKLQQHADCSVEIVVVKTIGDQDQTTRLDSFAGIGVFTREVQKAVLDGRADVAVHSLKDLPTQPEPGLLLASIPERGPRRDTIAMKAGSNQLTSLDDLPHGARVATGSPRRRAQLLHLRPDIEFVEVRGNVGTRVQKMDDGLCEAMLLAEAGLVRLGLEDRISLALSPESFLPAVGQGALGIECREDDNRTKECLGQLNHPATLMEVTAERTVLAELRAGCHAPLGVWARLEEGCLVVDAALLKLDGSDRIYVSMRGPADNPEALGVQVAQSLADGSTGHAP